MRATHDGRSPLGGGILIRGCWPRVALESPHSADLDSESTEPAEAVQEHGPKCTAKHPED